MKVLPIALSTFFLLIALVPRAMGFSDVTREHPDYLAIRYLTESRIVSGYTDGTFQSTLLINRAEVLKMILFAAETGLQEHPSEPFFSDVHQEDWFFNYVQKARELLIVQGDNNGSFFNPARNVTLAEFLKMLFKAHGISFNKNTAPSNYPDVPLKAWFAPYISYAVQIGMIQPDPDLRLHPQKFLTRGEVATLLYFLNGLNHGKDSAFLFKEANEQLVQIEIYMQAGKIEEARQANAFALNFSQQALRNRPGDSLANGFLKLAEAYRLVMDAFLAGAQGDSVKARDLSNLAISKATEAWEADHDTQPIARQIKERAGEIKQELGLRK